MKLRQKSKRDQALDATASIAKTWSEWRLGEKVAKTATKAGKGAGNVSKKAKKSSRGSKRKPAMIAGAIALIGGIAAAVKKLTGAKAEPLYTPPGPAPDMATPPPSPVAVEDLTKDPPTDRSTIVGTSVPPTVEPAHTASTEVPERDPSPVVVDDLAADAPAFEEPDAAPLAEDDDPETDLAPVPEDLVPDSADPAPADEDDKPA